MKTTTLQRAALPLALCMLALAPGCRKRQAEPPQTVEVSGDREADEMAPREPERLRRDNDENTRLLPTRTEPPTAAELTPRPVEGAWSTWRGNDERTGRRSAPAITTPTVAWRTEVGIGGYANTVIVDRDTIYVSTQGTSHDSADPRDGVVALDRADGTIRWRFRTAHDAGGMTLHDGRLYVVSKSGVVHAVDATSGQELWSRDLECPLWAAPLVHDEYVYVLHDGVPLRLYASNGVPEITPGSCRIGERGGASSNGDLVVSTGVSDHVRAWRGPRRWWTSSAPDDTIHRTRSWVPAQLAGDVVLSSYTGWPVPSDEARGGFEMRAAIVARWLDSGQVAWVHDAVGEDPSARFDASLRYFIQQPYVDGTRGLYASTRRPEVTIIDLTTGERAGGVPLPDCRTRQFASIVGTDEVAYLARHDGVLYQLQLGEAPSITWTFALGSRGVSGQRTTHDPQPAGRCHPGPVDGTALFATPAIGADGTVYVLSGEGWLYAIANR